MTSRAEKRRIQKAAQSEAKRLASFDRELSFARKRHEAHEAFLEKHGLKWTGREKSFFVLEMLWVFFGGPLVQFYYLWIWKPKIKSKKTPTN